MFVGYIQASYIVADTNRRALVKLVKLESYLWVHGWSKGEAMSML